MFQKTTIIFLIFLIGFLAGTVFELALAWRDPVGNPTVGTGQAIQADANSNVTISGGSLTVSGGNLVVSGLNNLGVRQASPASTFHVSGHARIGDTGVGARKGVTLFDVTDGQAYCMRVSTATLGIIAGTCEAVIGGN